MTRKPRSPACRARRAAPWSSARRSLSAARNCPRSYASSPSDFPSCRSTCGSRIVTSMSCAKAWTLRSESRRTRATRPLCIVGSLATGRSSAHRLSTSNDEDCRARHKTSPATIASCKHSVLRREPGSSQPGMGESCPCPSTAAFQSAALSQCARPSCKVWE